MPEPPLPEPPKPLTLSEARAQLKPGERAALAPSAREMMIKGGPTRIIVGKVPYDGSTRQQRRAMARGAA